MLPDLLDFSQNNHFGPVIAGLAPVPERRVT
jgi:hypothetical protein